MIRKPVCLTCVVAVALLFSLSGWANAAPPTPEQTAELAKRLDPFLTVLGGRDSSFAVHGQINGRISGVNVTATVKIERFDHQAWRLELKHDEYPFALDRTKDRTALVLPRHKVAIVGSGEVTGPDTLMPLGAALRLIGQRSAVLPYYSMLANSNGRTAAAMFTALLKLEPIDEAATHWSSPNAAHTSVQFGDGPSLTVTSPDGSISVELVESTADDGATGIPAGYAIRQVDRSEMERLLSRGARRALEVLAPGPLLTRPAQKAKQVEHGRVIWDQGQRVVLLKGTPEQVGAAHGRLLKNQIALNRDSVLYLVGIAQTMRTGRWAMDDLRQAWQRLAPFIPDDHKAEMAALARAGGFTIEETQLTNIFPELFHCSGFAVFGKATEGGKLYHGRVLDYMTKIGLQDASGIFVIAVDGKVPFVTVGYAGFIGSVSGMNVKQVSLGEMGGGGQGKWDGVPMSILMRRAMEECSTLDEVMKLWSDSPRTCEYYYVFADGKIPSAVGVAATPESVEFVKPGQAHPLLGRGIADTILLSSGDRLGTLRRRTEADYGTIDVDKAIGLMSRPVAMSSNLHNVLFVPQDLAFHVAHADHQDIAANRPYATFDLMVLLEQIPE